MSILMRSYQFSNKLNEKANGKWYGRPVIMGESGIEELAAMMQENCTVKRADILAVLSELGPTMKQVLQSGRRVRIPYLGMFKVSFSTEGQEKEEDVSERCITRMRLLFRPELAKRTTGDNRRQAEMLRGCQVESITRYNLETATTPTQGDGSGSETGGTDTGNTGGGSGNTGGGTLNPD